MVGRVGVEATLDRARRDLERLTPRRRLDRLEVQALGRTLAYERFNLLGDFRIERFFEAPFLAASGSEAASGASSWALAHCSQASQYALRCLRNSWPASTCWRSRSALVYPDVRPGFIPPLITTHPLRYHRNSFSRRQTMLGEERTRMKLACNLAVLVLAGGPGVTVSLAGDERQVVAVFDTERNEDEVKQPPGRTLYWLRCPIGQRWTGSSCEGDPRFMDWHEAKNACPGGYRLPTRQEFMSLLEGCDAAVRGCMPGFCGKCAKTSKCSSIFGEDTGWYWTSSSVMAASSHAWYVLFDVGYVYYGDKDLVYHVRCVRSGPRAEEEEARRKAEAEERERPAMVEAESKDVKQPGTNLYWLRCPTGQRWTGSFCEGVEKWMNWQEANNACPSGYRLPTRQEFTSLLGGCDAAVLGGNEGDCNGCLESSNCSSMFGKDELAYWSSSTAYSDSSNSWCVYFDYGYVHKDDKDFDGSVRCVRSGP